MSAHMIELRAGLSLDQGAEFGRCRGRIIVLSVARNARPPVRRSRRHRRLPYARRGLPAPPETSLYAVRPRRDGLRTKRPTSLVPRGRQTAFRGTRAGRRRGGWGSSIAAIRIMYIMERARPWLSR